MVFCVASFGPTSKFQNPLCAILSAQSKIFARVHHIKLTGAVLRSEEDVEVS